MKKINKKLLGVGVIVLFFSVALVFLVKAQVGGEYFFRVNSASTTPSDAKRAGDEVRIKIINRSGKDYFAPNKSKAEFESFQQFAPKYVSVSVCGDGVCGEGETMYNCNDCVAEKVQKGCGDGYCDINYAFMEIDTVISTTSLNASCEQNAGVTLFIGIPWSVITGTVFGCLLGGPVGCAATITDLYAKT
jgi:hypothetical protein